MVEAEVAVSYAPGGIVQASEVFGPACAVADGSLSYLVTHVNERSQLVEVSSANAADFPLTTVTSSRLSHHAGRRLAASVWRGRRACVADG